MTCVGGGTRRNACKAEGPPGGARWTDRDRKRFVAAGWYLWPKDCAVEFDGTALCPLHRNAGLEARIDASSSTARRMTIEDLRRLVKERAYRKGDFTLSSGKKSPYYFDGKQVLLDQRGSILFADWLLEQIAMLSEQPVAIGGLEIGAIPIACVAMARADFNLGTFVVRKKPKAHGTGNQIDGDVKHGDAVVVVDDVITTGESTMKAVRALEEVGCRVLAIYCLVDRQEGHTPEFDERGAIFKPAFTVGDLSLPEPAVSVPRTGEEGT